MSAPLKTTGASSESHTWHELEDVFAALGQLARSAVSPPEFYRTVLDQSARALAAVGGTAWLRAGGAMQPIARVGWSGDDAARDDDARQAHEALLLEAVTEGRVLS